MKKNKLACLAMLAIILVLQSCVPDPPPKPIRYDLKKSNNLISSVSSSKYAEPGPNCPKVGDDCLVPVYAPNTNEREIVINEWIGFKSYYDNNNVPAYFAQTHGWENLFPAFTYQSNVVDSLVSGSYKAHIFSDSTIVIYKNSDYYGDNLIFTIRIN